MAVVSICCAPSRRISESTSRLADGKETGVVVTSCMVAYSWGNRVVEQPNSNPSTPPSSTPHPQLLVISPIAQRGDVISFAHSAGINTSTDDFATNQAPTTQL